MNQIVAQTVVDTIDDVIDTSQVTAWDFLWAALCIIGGVIISRLGRRYAKKYGVRSNLPSNLVDLMGTLITWAVMPLATIVAFTFVGLDVSPWFILLIFILIVFAIGGRALLEAFSAGVMLQTRSPFVRGDYVTVFGETGVVVEVDSRVVTLDTRDGRRISLPNQQVLRYPIENKSSNGRRMSRLDLDVEYGTDLERAIDIALTAVLPLEQILQEPAPSCRVSAFAESSVRLGLRFWHAPMFLDEIDAIDVAARAVYRAFRERGIVFAFPNQTVWLNQDDTARTGGPDDERRASDVSLGTPNPEASKGRQER